MFIVLLFVLLNITSIYSSTQIIRVRENVNVTITCDFNRIKSKLTANQLSSISSLNKLLDNNLSDNIILWYKDDSQVIGVTTISNEPNKYSVNEINTNTYELTIINVHLESSGVYKCQNFTSKEETRFQLNVMAPPSRLRLVPSAQMPIPDGTLVSFNCTSERVYPNPTFEWYKNDKLIQRSIGNQTGSALFSSSSILTLLLTPADHNHMLRCQVSNEASNHESNVEIKLDVLFKPIIKILYNEKELTKKLNIVENSIEVIHCQVSSNPSVISNIEWFKNDQLIRGENQEQLRINFTDIKSLSCRATNNIGRTENRINVNILYKPKLFMTENITLNQGENLHLKCTIDANPSCHDIRWLHNDKELLTQSCQQQKADEYNIPKSNRSHAGKYTCEVRNLLNTTFHTQQHGVSRVSTDVYLQLPTSYALTPGLYRCVATNMFGQHEFSIQFQRPSFPDPPTGLQAINITHSSFILQWQPGYNGGSDQVYHIILNHSHTEERFSNFNSIQFKDLNEKTRYTVKIRSKNKIGFSDYSTNLVVITKESAIRSEEFPIINRAYYRTRDRQLHYQLSSTRSMSMPIDQFCIRYYNIDEISPCIPLRSMQLIDDGIKINIEPTNLHVKLCLMNKTDTCSKSIPISPHIPVSNHSSEFLIILIGGVLGSFIVFGLMILFVCVHHRKYKQKSRSGSTDTLKTNSDNFHSVAPIRVSNTNSCLYYPTNQNRTLYFNDETIGIYSIQDKKSSICFDSGMPSTTSNNSDSAGSQALSSSDFYDRSDGEYLVNGPRSMNKLISSNILAYTTVGTGRENHLNISANRRISSEAESAFSTLGTSQNGKKRVYEVVV
ncbi:unnamed protein product [Rotaria magnacalcarata]|uniref:Uncharacterized protein n=1 Tax=Rotaria magnacalcarata TaxID=392030 RepID=A0A8S2MZU5_9BILA|nr:unnamed protein product [Rotaria magnacalcarata]